MRILVIGGSGVTGRVVIDEALQRGHKVTALVRNPSVLPNKEGLNLVKGSPVEASSVESAFNAVPGEPPNAVIVTLSAPMEKGTRVMSQSHENLLDAMQKHGVSKIVTMSSWGVGASYPTINFLMKFVISHSRLTPPFQDHNRVEDILRKSSVQFVILKPARLTMSNKAPVKYLGDGKGQGIFAGMSGISRASVAACLVDATEKSTWDRTTPVISN